MRAMPQVFVLVWQDNEGRCIVTQHESLDECCAFFDESPPAMDVIASASVSKVAIEVKPLGKVWQQRWVPFDIGAAHRAFLQEGDDEVRERDRARMQLRKEQNA